MPTIRKSLDRLSSVAHRLNQETDTLNWVIEDVGSQLQKMNLGVVVWDDVLLEAETEPSDDVSITRTRGWVVGHVKIKERWRLAVKQIRVEESSDPDHPVKKVYRITEPSPLLRASRVIRVQAVRRLEPLLERLAATVDSYVEDITRARSLVGD